VIRWALLLLLLAVTGFVGATALAVRYLRDAPPPTSAFMLRARRADPATGLACPAVEWQWVDRAQIAGSLPVAVVLAEDQRFLLHRGFDMRQIQKALKEHGDGGRQRGASTLTQQVAKNLFLWPGGGFLRKGLEAWFVVWIERTWSKGRILEIYLNVAQFGPCVFGAEAASQRYFERSAAELQPEQAALLATVLPNPARLRAWNPGPYAQERRAEILELMETHRHSRHVRGL
jgi:monofunctional biosynthetic peptidoglycan transglycosylase